MVRTKNHTNIVDSAEQVLKEKKQFFINNVAKYCDKCGNAYTLEDLNIIQDTGLSSIIHFSCQSCKSTHIATFVKPIGVSSRMPINTDLSVKELPKFAKAKRVSVDDVLSVYTALDKDQAGKGL